MKTAMAKNLGQAAWDYVNDHSQILLFVLEPDGRIIEANRFAQSTTGCRPGRERFQDLIIDFHEIGRASCRERV